MLHDWRADGLNNVGSCMEGDVKHERCVTEDARSELEYLTSYLYN